MEKINRISHDASISLARYVSALMKQTKSDSPVGIVLARWCWDYAHIFGFDLAKDLTVKTKKGKSHLKPLKRPGVKPLADSAWEKLTAMLEKNAAQPGGTALYEQASTVARFVELDTLDTDIFIFVAMTTGDSTFSMLIDDIIATRRLDTISVVAAMINRCPMRVSERLTRGTLTQLGLIQGHEEGLDLMTYMFHTV